MVLRLWRLQAALVMTLAATPGEPTSTNYFNWKKGALFFHGPFAEYSRRNRHLQLVLSSLLLVFFFFFFWMK